MDSKPKGTDDYIRLQAKDLGHVHGPKWTQSRKALMTVIPFPSVTPLLP